MNNTSMIFSSFLSTAPSILIITISLIIGILSGFWALDYIYPYAFIFIIAFLLLSMAFFLPQLHIITIFLIGFIRVLSFYHGYNQFPFDKLKEPSTITGVATLISDSTQKRFKQIILIQPISIQIKNATLFLPPSSGAFQFYTKGIKNIKEGDTVAFRNIVLKKIKNGSFQTYLMKEGICTTLFIENPDYSVIKRPTYSYIQSVATLKNRLYSSLKTKIKPKTFALLSSLFLGNKTYKKEYLDVVADNFKQWGISHFLARSGLHLVIFILIWELILRLIPWRYTIKCSLLLVLSILYFILSWSSVSFIRAFLIFIFTKYCNLHRHPTHFMHILLLTCCVVLLINPLQLFFLDFQLSFFLTFGLSWISLYCNKEQQPNQTIAFKDSNTLKWK